MHTLFIYLSVVLSSFLSNRSMDFSAASEQLLAGVVVHRQVQCRQEYDLRRALVKLITLIPESLVEISKVLFAATITWLLQVFCQSFHQGIQVVGEYFLASKRTLPLLLNLDLDFSRLLMSGIASAPDVQVQALFKVVVLYFSLRLFFLFHLIIFSILNLFN